MSSWEKRQVYQKIENDIISRIPDNLLTWAMFDHILLKIGKDYEKTTQILAELPSGFSIVYHLFVLDGEIGNGGFNQYFFNGLDANAKQQFEALGLIEATEHQKVFLKAFRIHNDEKQNEELQSLYSQRTIETFFSTYEITTLDKCDDEWYELDKEFDSLLVKYIRLHPELFIT
jgi:hypothetical protein